MMIAFVAGNSARDKLSAMGCETNICEPYLRTKNFTAYSWEDFCVTKFSSKSAPKLVQMYNTN